MTRDQQVTAWLAELERRHLADLTTSEAARALRALSSCYVERRARLAEGAALGSKGKRAAFALFYGPLHYFVIREVLSVLPGACERLRRIVDLGCGTGASGIAWATAAGARSIVGYDRNPWAAAEAEAAYRSFGLSGRAFRRDVAKIRLDVEPGSGVLAAYTINELDSAERAAVLDELRRAHGQHAALLIVEPIARRPAPWWDDWRAALEPIGARADEWRFPAALPPTQQALARAAGLNPRELTARTLWVPPARPR